jgi:hypothetical protein
MLLARLSAARYMAESERGMVARKNRREQAS